MKKIILVLVMVVSAFSINAQVSKIITAEGQSKKNIHSLLNQWIAESYNSAQSVIQMNDKEAGILVVKGKSTLMIKSMTKELYSKNKMMTRMLPDYNAILVDVKIAFEVRDGRYKITITGLDGKPITEEAIKTIEDSWTDVPYISAKKELLFKDAAIKEAKLYPPAEESERNSLLESIESYVNSKSLNNNSDW